MWLHKQHHNKHISCCSNKCDKTPLSLFCIKQVDCSLLSLFVVFTHFFLFLLPFFRKHKLHVVGICKFVAEKLSVVLILLLRNNFFLCLCLCGHFFVQQTDIPNLRSFLTFHFTKHELQFRFPKTKTTTTKTKNCQNLTISWCKLKHVIIFAFFCFFRQQKTQKAQKTKTKTKKHTKRNQTENKKESAIVKNLSSQNQKQKKRNKKQQNEQQNKCWKFCDPFFFCVFCSFFVFFDTPKIGKKERKN